MFRKKISEGDKIPKGYGESWAMWNPNITVCHPYPINIVFGFLRLLWNRTRHFSFAWSNSYVERLESELVRKDKNIEELRSCIERLRA